MSSTSPQIADLATRQPTGTNSEFSIDSILLRFASHSTSPAGQISGFDGDPTLYSGNIGSENTGFRSEESNSLEEYQTTETPCTSEAGPGDEDVLNLDQDPLDPALNRALLFVGLEFPEAFRRTLFSSGTNSDCVSDLSEIPELLRNPQARPDAASWVPNTDALPDPVEVAQAPSPGPTYNAYHSPMRQYTRGSGELHNEGKGITARSRMQSPSIRYSCKIVTENPHSDRDVSLISQFSGNPMRSHHVRSRDQENTDIDLKLFRGIDSISNSLITKVSLFHPGFLVSHLYANSVSAFTAQICAPNTYIDPSEHPVSISLGFGPDVCFQVSPFIPKDKQALWSFQKHEGDDTLHVQDSLPIALNCFSVESTAETLDDWLDKIVNSQPYLSEYVDLMMELHSHNLSAKILQEGVSWFLKNSSKLSELAQKIIRNALKLLLTITTLTLVPKVTRLPSSLSVLLQWPSSSVDSAIDAPKLLTRQIKSSTYYLQVQLLRALFSDLDHGKGLVAPVKLLVGLVVSFGLELVSDSAKMFAKYANKVNQTVSVLDVEVKDYERKMERDIFDRIRASVYDYPRGADVKMGKLGARLRTICQSSRKGKGKEDDGCRFVSAILTPVF